MTDAASEGRPSIAFLGLGRMGSTMATRLLDAGFPVSVWNRTSGRAGPLVERGAVELPRLADALASDLVFSMVLDDAALDALHGEGGLFAAPTADLRAKAWIDGSTVSPAAAGRAAEAAHAAGLGYASAPVSGNPGVVAAGRAIFAVSGDAGAVELVGPVLGALGRATHRMGASSEANVAKLATNALLAVVMQTLAEVNVLADRAGLARSALMAFINDSAVGSPFSAYKTRSIVELDFTPTFTMEGQRKDARLALALAADLEVPMPVLSTTEVAFSRTIASGLGVGQDLAALLLGAAHDAGVRLEPEQTSEQ